MCPKGWGDILNLCQDLALEKLLGSRCKFVPDVPKFCQGVRLNSNKLPSVTCHLSYLMSVVQIIKNAGVLVRFCHQVLLLED